MSETKTYAILVDTEEIYMKCLKEHDKEAEKTVREWAEMVHPDPLGRFQAFLYRTQEERKEAYEHIKKVFKTAKMAKQVAYVDTRYVKRRERRDGK